MYSVEEQTERLIEAIKMSHEYVQYQSICDELDQSCEVRKRLNQFRKRQFQIQLEGTDCMERSNALYTEFGDIMELPLVKEFLRAEMRYCKMIRNVNNRITENLEFDINFLEEDE